MKKKRIALAAAGIVAAALLTLWVLVATAPHVSFSVDGHIWQGQSIRRTVAGALAAAHVKLAPGDIVAPAADAHLSGGELISVVRGRPVHLITTDGTKDIISAAGTAAGLLRDAGIAVEGDYRTKVKIDARRQGALTVEVVKVKTETVTSQVAIAYKTERRPTPTLELGIEKELQKGVQGLKEVQYKVTYENGKVAKRTVIAETILKEPVMRLVAVGTSGTATTRGGEQIKFQRALMMRATGYTAGPESTGKYATGYTYLGMKASYGVVAVDPKVIPLRSRLYIDGYGFAVAGDIGGAIKGNRIDLCFDTVAEANTWGVRQVKVYIIEEGSGR